MAPTRVLLTCTVLGLSATARAQVPDSAAPVSGPVDAVSAQARSFGLAPSEAGFIAGGPDYKASFEPGGFTFTPALGMRAETNQTLSFALESISLGGAPFVRVDEAVAPEESAVDGAFVRYLHGTSVVEQYEVQSAGIHQSFVFHELPAGSGDLVVRGRLSSDFATVSDEAGGLRFETSQVGGVSYGGVTGIDAAGETVAGSLRLDGDHLELVLPADFVAQAELPLVLDPLIGSLFSITDNTNADGCPDVAFSTGSNNYLVVWERVFAIGDVDIRAQRLTANGTFEGGLIFLESASGTVAANPAVATVSQNDRFAVVWQQTTAVFVPFNIVLRAVRASNGSLSSAIAVSGSGVTQINPDVGGERTNVDDDVVVVWDESGVGIRARQVTIPAPGNAPSTQGSTVTVQPNGTSSDLGSPAISKSAGEAGRFLIAWRSSGSTLANPVQVRVVTRNLTLLDSGPTNVSFFITGFSNNFRPDCDGDGTNFVVAWDRDESLDDGVYDIVVRSLSFQSGDVNLGPLREIENDQGDDERAPSIAYFGSQYVVAYQDLDPGNYNTYVKSIDPFLCTICESEETLQGNSDVNRGVSVCSRYSGGDSSNGTIEDGLIVWESFDLGASAGAINGFRYTSPVTTFNLAGDCGSGGETLTPCPMEGNASFTPQLRSASASAPAVLVIGFNELAIGCGSCLIWPDLSSQTVINFAMTDSDGNASFNVPIPAGAAGTFVAQWAVFSGASCPLIGGFDLSNGLRFTLF